MADSFTLVIAVKPNARSSGLSQDDAGRWTARLKSPPIDGKANDELIALVAERFGCRRASVTLKSGASGRLKRVVVSPD